jgi:hypothetical protein
LCVVALSGTLLILCAYKERLMVLTL